jgi:hypothetical protein
VPGLFGFFGSDVECGVLLREKFAERYPDMEFTVSANGKAIIGGHSHALSKPIKSVGYLWLAVDGERSVYRLLNSATTDTCRNILDLQTNRSQVPPECKGNILVYDDNSSKVCIFRDWSSCFPIYFTRYKGNFIVCSYITPLAEVTNAEIDQIGMVEYMLSGYSIGSRTQFKNISKLCPGQIGFISMPTGNLEIKETSRLWSGSGQNEDVTQGKDKVVQRLGSIWEENLRIESGAPNLGVMLSAGWDSRLVLSSILSRYKNTEFLCVTYENSHKQSRETDIVNAIVKKLKLRHQNEKAILNPSNIDSFYNIFRKTETCCFPEWSQIGKSLSDQGINLVTCGILGEVLGGHYGQGFIGSGLDKIIHFVKTYFNMKTSCLSVEEAADALCRYHLIIPWYINDGLNKTLLLEGIRGDLNQVTERYLNRGITEGERLLEAFITEHRGMGHIAEQSLAVRGHIDITLPFADRSIIETVTDLPHRYKINNKLTKALINKLCPQLLAFPTAAILVDTNYPIVIQEASRFFRIVIDKVSSTAFIRSKGNITHPLIWYRNCEYLRQGDSFKSLLNYISLEYLDKKRFESLIDKVKDYRDHTPLWFLFWQLTKLLTLDFMYHGKKE